MLIGTILYYNASTGSRLSDMDKNATPEDAQKSSRIYSDVIAEWSCANGDPNDVRWYVGGSRIEFAGLPAAMREGR